MAEKMILMHDLLHLYSYHMTDYIVSQEQLNATLGRTESENCLTLQVVDDSLQEDDETFQLMITSLHPVDPRIQLDLVTTTVTIVDDDNGKFYDRS